MEEVRPGRHEFVTPSVVARTGWRRSAEGEDGVDVSNDVLALHARAVGVARGVVEGIRPDQLGEPTPCSEWDVREVLDHLTGFYRSLVAAAAGDALADDETGREGEDPRAAFVALTGEAATVLREPGALDRSYPMPWGEMPGGALARTLAMDLTIHAWDLARATG